MTSMRCEYGPIIDDRLTRPLTIGQGGHWEGSGLDAYRSLVRLAAGFSSAIGNEMHETYGEAGKAMIAKAAGAYGRYRGMEIRRVVEKNGLPNDLPHMWSNWDLPVIVEGDEREADDITPNYHGYQVSECPYEDVYRKHYRGNLPAIHCVAMHTAAFQAFNPAMEFWLTSLMPRGERKCVFRMRIADEAAREMAARFKGKDVSEPERKAVSPAVAYRAEARQAVIIFHFFTSTLLDEVGVEQAEALLRRAMAHWGTIRGEEMREAHLVRGWPLNLKSFVTYFDDPSAGDAWVAKDYDLTETGHRKVITRSAWAELFYDLGTGPQTRLISEVGLPAMARAYHPAMTVSIPRLLERGDAATEIQYTLAL
jgi:hypothetical protein